MGNRADPRASHQVAFDDWLARQDPDDVKGIGPCQCPGTPHARDVAVVRDRFGYGAKGEMRETTRRAGIEAGQLRSLLLGLVSWNLVLEDGTARPLDAGEIGLLDDRSIEWLTDALLPAWDDPPLPNASSAPSPDGSQASAGLTPTTPTSTETPATSTTS